LEKRWEIRLWNDCSIGLEDCSRNGFC